jgi:YD repeat-containing protein
MQGQTSKLFYDTRGRLVGQVNNSIDSRYSYYLVIQLPLGHV